MAREFTTSLDVLKVDEELGLVFGWGMVCSSDSDGERIPTSEMLQAVTEFSLESERPSDDMHDGEQDGTVVHSFPLTDEIAKVFGIACQTQGWMVAVKPSAEVLEKFKDGTYTGFSIGGTVESWDPDTEAAA